MKHIRSRTVLLTLAALLGSTFAGAATLGGELKTWHKITLTFDGPMASEKGDPNPFLDYNLTVTFRHQNGTVYTVPGYFAADGNAAVTSATSGDQWRAHFAPGAAGQWNWKVSFRQGENAAVDASRTGRAWAPLDGQTGTFEVSPSDKSGRDFRAKGRLEYVGEHYLRFAGTGEYFLKCGVDAQQG